MGCREDTHRVDQSKVPVYFSRLPFPSQLSSCSQSRIKTKTGLHVRGQQVDHVKHRILIGGPDIHTVNFKSLHIQSKD